MSKTVFVVGLAACTNAACRQLYADTASEDEGDVTWRAGECLLLLDTH